jgi:two-component system, sensor histidine kinase
VEPASPRPIVAIVENDQMAADALLYLMRDWGYQPIVGRSASQVAKALGARIESVRAIVVDYQLDDGFTGIRAASALVAAIGRPVPTIVTTGYPLIAEKEEAFPVLWKPFDPWLLQNWLDTHVNCKPNPAASNPIGSVP